MDDINGMIQLLTVPSFWGFYLGRPFRMNAGDITVAKPASNLGAAKVSTWYPYGLPTDSDLPSGELKNQNELISRQMAVLWEIVSPVGHILYVTLSCHGWLYDKVKDINV